MRAVAKERSGWRDEALSQRHRRWGWNCPAVDLDFLCLEYDSGKAVALVEYKHQNSPTQYAAHPSYRALVDLGNRAGIPVFAVRYGNDFSWWRVISLNDQAVSIIGEEIKMTEREWVTFLYKLRGQDISESLLDQLERAI